MTAHTQFPHSLQHLGCAYSQPEELRPLLNRSWPGKSENEVDQDRNLACAAFLLGHMDKREFAETLREWDVIGSTDHFWRAYATGVLALAAESESTAPVPPVAVRERNKAEGRAA